MATIQCDWFGILSGSVSRDSSYVLDVYGTAAEVSRAEIELPRHAFVAAGYTEAVGSGTFRYRSCWTPRPSWVDRGGYTRELAGQLRHVSGNPKLVMDIGRVSILGFSSGLVTEYLAGYSAAVLRLVESARQVASATTEFTADVLEGGSEALKGTGKVVQSLGVGVGTLGAAVDPATSPFPRLTGLLVLGAVAWFLWPRLMGARSGR